MSTRRALDTHVVSSQDVAVTYQVSLDPLVLESVRTSFEHSGQSWPKWVAAAIDRLLRETDDELTNLLSNQRPASRVGKHNLPFRLYPATLAKIKKIAADYDSSIQVVLSHAFFMHSLA